MVNTIWLTTPSDQVAHMYLYGNMVKASMRSPPFEWSTLRPLKIWLRGARVQSKACVDHIAIYVLHGVRVNERPVWNECVQALKPLGVHILMLCGGLRVRLFFATNPILQRDMPYMVMWSTLPTGSNTVAISCLCAAMTHSKKNLDNRWEQTKRLASEGQNGRSTWTYLFRRGSKCIYFL